MTDTSQNGDRLEGRALRLVTSYDRELRNELSTLRKEMAELRTEVKRSTSKRIWIDAGGFVGAIAVVITVWLSVSAKVDAARGDSARAIQEAALAENEVKALETNLTKHEKEPAHDGSRDRWEDIAEIRASIEELKGSFSDFRGYVRRNSFGSR